MKKVFDFEKVNSATKDTPFVSLNARNFGDYPHFHDEIEFVQCDKGYFQITTNDVSIKLNEGEIYFFMPYEIHNITSEQGSYGTVVKMLPIAEDIAFTRITFFDKHIKKSHKAYSEMYNAFERLKNPPFPQMLSCAAAANELFLLAMQNIEFDVVSEAEVRTKLKNIAILDKVHRYLKNNYMNKISLEETAKFCAMSKFHFSHVFKSVSGICFCDYVTKYRLNKAIEIMKTSNKTQLDIAYSCGFNNFQTYIRSFERFFDTTPNRYKKMLLKSVSEKKY